MKTFRLALGFSVLALTALHGQAPGMRRVLLRGGIEVDLPTTWVLRDSAYLLALKDTVGRIIRGVRVEAPLRIDAATGATLLVADGPSWTTATLGVVRAPGATAQTFADYSPEQLELFQKATCDVLAQAQLAQGRRAPVCGAMSRDSVRGRFALVMEYDREAAQGELHAFNVQVTAPDAIVRLTLMSRPETARANGQLFRQIWRSLAIPDSIFGQPAR